MKLIATDKGSEQKELPLDLKIMLSQNRIRDWYEHFGGQVYISFSGGKDSLVLADMVWSIYPEVPALFSNTGLEYPEICRFVLDLKKSGKPIVITRPKKTFREIILEEGFPLISKKVSMMVRRLRKPRTAENDATHNLYLTGVRRDGVFVAGSKLPEKWRPLIDAPFGTTERCCDALKKEPFRRYEKETGRVPYVGVMRSEGGARSMLETCNSFDGKSPQSRPMLFWEEKDVWEYIKARDLEYAEIYDDVAIDGVLVPGETRTGCMFCAFGAHLEKGDNRFQRMAIRHPKLWNYCINKLGMGPALDFIGVDYRPKKKEDQMELFTAADQAANK